MLINKISERLAWVDFAKGFAIILVVYRHIMIGIERAGLDVDYVYVVANEIVFTFRMPLFFILTGIFIEKSLGRRKSREFVSNKFDTLMYPYLIWATIQVTIQVVMSNFTNANRGALDYLYILIQPRAIDQFWYLFALFNVSILFLLIYKYTNLKRVYLVLLAIVLHYLSQYVSDYSLIHDTLYYFIFLCVGYITSHFLLDFNFYKKFNPYLTFLIILPIFVATQIYWLNNQPLNIFVLTTISLLGSAMAINISILGSKIPYFNFFAYAGKYSLYIYVLHVIVSAAARIVFIHFFNIQNVPFLLITGIVVGTILPIVIYKYSHKFGYNFLFYPPKNKPSKITIAK